jgi:hypothetical protein
MLAMLFCIVRMAAAWHTHEAASRLNSVDAYTTVVAHSFANFNHSNSAPSPTAENDDCPLCHLLSQGMTNILLVALVFALALLLVLRESSFPSSPVHRFISRLSDRAPPRFA